MRQSITFCVCFSLLLASSSVLAQTYRWVDPKTGQTMISDTPPPSSAKLLDRVAAPAADPYAGLSVAGRRAVQNFPVTLYTAEACVAECKEARALLNKRGVPFAEKVIKTPADQAELKALVGSAEVPTIKVGRESMKGFLAEDYDKLLDLAGYPRQAPYGKSGTAPK